MRSTRSPVRYTEWVEAVLRAALARPGPEFHFGMQQLGTSMGLKVGNWGDPAHRALQLSISAAAEDLEERRLLATVNQYNLEPALEARRYRTHPLRELWPALRAGHLETDEEAYLAKLAELSEVEHDGWAETRWVASAEVFAALGWAWDRGRSLAIGRALDRGVFAEVRPVDDTVRLRLAGAVRVNDEVGSVLAEARDHVAVGLPRAAGCVAGVELERRLKELCNDPAVMVTGKLPTIADYNDALKRARVYPQATWRKIQHLADLRNRCAHVLELEPTLEDARELVDGIDAVLRALAV